MKHFTETRKMILAALFIALGLIIPYFAGHMFGVPGVVLLPMHIPVLMAGLLIGARYGFIVGIITPILSSVLTGMPPMYPVLPTMIVELAVYGWVSGMVRHRLKWGLYPALILAMIAGRVASGLVFGPLFFGTTFGEQWAIVVGNVTTGLPGIAIQLAFIPALVMGIERYLVKDRVVNHPETLYFEGPAFENAKDKIAKEGTSVVLIKENTITTATDGRGISPLLRLYDEQPMDLKNAFVVDRLIGKAAAMLLVAAGVNAVYGHTMSRKAARYLSERNIPYRNHEEVEFIGNMDNTGLCPMEDAVKDIEDPQSGVNAIRERLAELRKNNA